MALSTWPAALRCGCAEGEVVEVELGEGFAGAEVEVFDDVDVVLGGPLLSGCGRSGGGHGLGRRGDG